MWLLTTTEGTLAQQRTVSRILAGSQMPLALEGKDPIVPFTSSYLSYGVWHRVQH